MLFIHDFEQWKWIESIHLTGKYGAFSSFVRWEPVYLVLNSKIFYLFFFFYLNCTSISRISAKLYSPCPSGCTAHGLVSSLCVFVIFHIFYLLSHQVCQILLSYFLFFFLSSILVQTLLQIQHFPNCIQGIQGMFASCVTI